ncbi:hypothetical protein [Cellulosimicrobium cellulans]|uniref:hypothetical protein n=1 Tax=Cellulosimicrobium cellulans TaxID=1710 RepID=UPI002096F410|nr:hypothetical protein [Cellulosimicrobium cellulans]MCO7273339.1 hypothetical protein [Cellulosimicrobium cellulans]
MRVGDDGRVDDGRVAVRFETARPGPGRQRWEDLDVEDLTLVEPLGPDGVPVRGTLLDREE